MGVDDLVAYHNPLKIALESPVAGSKPAQVVPFTPMIQ